MNFPVPSLALVVEDDPFQREVLSDVLKEEKLDVIQCESAEAAELVVAEVGAELALLVTDVRLAGEGNGADLARFAKSCWPHLRVIVVSGDSRAPLPPGICFLRKPYQISELLGVLWR
jgi:DNA-binding NtrC family response regulator